MRGSNASGRGARGAGGLAGPALLAHVLTAKYCDHLPLYRQSGIYQRAGVDRFADIEVRDGGLGFEQTLADDLAHRRHGDVAVGAIGTDDLELGLFRFGSGTSGAAGESFSSCSRM